jgi:hypothetical protein
LDPIGAVNPVDAASSYHPAVLELADSLDLGLTEEQVAAITTIRDTLIAQHTQLANDLRAELEGQDAGGDPECSSQRSDVLLAWHHHNIGHPQCVSVME